MTRAYVIPLTSVVTEAAKAGLRIKQTSPQFAGVYRDYAAVLTLNVASGLTRQIDLDRLRNLISRGGSK